MTDPTNRPVSYLYLVIWGQGQGLVVLGVFAEGNPARVRGYLTYSYGLHTVRRRGAGRVGHVNAMRRVGAIADPNRIWATQGK